MISKILTTNHITESHEFTINYQGSTATIECKFENESEAFNNPITLIEFKEMIIAATFINIEVVVINTNYSIEVHSSQIRILEKKHNIKIKIQR